MVKANIWFWIIMIVGWILNVVQFAHMAATNSPITTMFVAKIVGIFAFPLGTILGYLGLF